MKILKRLGLAVLILLVVAVAGFVIWAEMPLGPMPEALTALQSDAQVEVNMDPWLTFTPAAQAATGLIIYPGGRVDARSYAPLAHQIAAAGYLVIIPPMPLNLAVFAPGRAAEVMAAHPEIQRWVIGGHSLGGSMAANFVYKNPGMMAGLVLWASYPADNNALTEFDLPILSIYGTEDMGIDGIEASRPLLPAQTEWVVMDGGNHAQFGWYGPQPGDGTATITRSEEQAQILAATLAFLHGIDK